MELIELLLNFVALPFVIGMFVYVTVTTYDSRQAQRRVEERNFDSQLGGATVCYKNVMEDAERLLASMRYHAWNVAWRKVRPEGIFSEDLIEDDEKKWNEYDAALSNWRRKKLQYKKEIETYFGKRDATSGLFHILDCSFDKLSFELFFIYHENPSNPNSFMQHFVEDVGMEYESIFNAIMTSLDKKLTREQEDKVHQTTSIAFDSLQDKVSQLCSEMSESIKKGNVGNLRKNSRKSLMRQRSARRK
jgi:hypothetical protein